MRRGRWAAVALAIAAVVVILGLRSQRTERLTAPAQPSALPRQGSPGEELAAAQRAHVVASLDERTLARAVAALGLLAEGDARAWAALSAAERQAAQPLDALVGPPRQRGAGLCQVGPRGVQRLMPPGADLAHEERLRRGGLDLAERLGQLAAPRVEGAYWLVPHPGSLATDGAAGEQVITGPGLWAAIRHDPARDGAHLRIRDASAATAGGHALIVRCDDPAQVRLDGGFIVPGRAYRIAGAVTIEAAAPVGLEIRPLPVLTAYDEAPLCIPGGAG